MPDARTRDEDLRAAAGGFGLDPGPDKTFTLDFRDTDTATNPDPDSRNDHGYPRGLVAHAGEWTPLGVAAAGGGTEPGDRTER